MTLMRAAATTVLIVGMTSVFWPVRAQDPPPIWAGVYTAGQAERGRVVVQHHCSECHGEVQRMEAATQVSSLEMGFCLECHRRRGASTDCLTCHY